MSDDLVKRLRSPMNVLYEYAADDGAILREAAARIEELEALVEKYRDAAAQIGRWIETGEIPR